MTPSVNWQRCRQYTEWLKALPPNLQGSALADALQATCDLDKLQAIAPRAASVATDDRPPPDVPNASFRNGTQQSHR
jgi:hypothetical protein